MRRIKECQHWFETLTAALESEGLYIEFQPIAYASTESLTFADGTRYGHFVSVYRSDSGRYERPVHTAISLAE